MSLTDDEIGRRIEALRAAKRKQAEGGKLAGRLTDDEIDQAIEDREREEQQVATATTETNGQARLGPVPTCQKCGRPKTLKARGWWCKPCWWDAKSTGGTPVVNPRPPKPTYPEPTALERQMAPDAGPAAPETDIDASGVLAEVEAMRMAAGALAPLPADARGRVARWLSERFAIGA